MACDGSNVNPVAINILQAKLANGNYLIPSSTNGTFQNSPLSVPGIYKEDQYIANSDWLLNAKPATTEDRASRLRGLVVVGAEELRAGS